MSENKYQIKREGNHFTLSSKKQEHNKSQSADKVTSDHLWKSLFSKLGTFFGLIFSGLMVAVSFLIATPFFILVVLFNWIKIAFGLGIFWVIAFFAYDTIILNNGSYRNPFESGWTVLILLVIAFIGAIMATIGEMKN